MKTSRGEDYRECTQTDAPLNLKAELSPFPVPSWPRKKMDSKISRPKQQTPPKFRAPNVSTVENLQSAPAFRGIRIGNALLLPHRLFEHPLSTKKPTHPRETSLLTFSKSSGVSTSWESYWVSTILIRNPFSRARNCSKDSARSSSPRSIFVNLTRNPLR